MKYINGILFLFLVILLITCKKIVTQPHDSITVFGTLNGLETDFMTRSYRDSSGNRVSDSIMVENESFTYTTHLDHSEFIFFWPNVESTMKRTERGYYPVKSSQLAFLANPGDRIEFQGKVTDFIDAYPTGTKSNDELAAINRVIFPMMNRSVNYLLESGTLPADDPRKKIVLDSVKILDSLVIALKLDFVMANPSSEAAAWYLSDMMLRNQISDDDAITAFNNFNELLIGYRYCQEVAKRVKGIEATVVGNTLQNFKTRATLSGELFELKSLEGKYILIDFWGTWCGPCIAEMPKVKEYREKYADKLAVLGVNQGDSKAKITEFIAPKGYTWTHLLNGEDDANFVLNFNVAGFPTKFIIDPNGKILNRFVGDSEESFTYLDSLLN